MYSKRHYMLVSPPADTKEQIAERIAHNQILKQVRAEVAARYNPITQENAVEAITWQQKRIEELTAERNHK
jgi:hypothetical protein